MTASKRATKAAPVSRQGIAVEGTTELLAVGSISGIGSKALQVLERVAWTFVQGAAGTYVVAPTVANISQAKQVAAAMLAGGIAAVISLAKNLSLAARTT